MRQIVGRLVTIGQRDVAFGLRQLGVMLAQQGHRVGRRRSFARASFQQPALAGERRIAARRGQQRRRAFEIVRLHARRGQVVGYIIGDRRQLPLQGLQLGDRGCIILLLVRRNSEREIGERGIFRMAGQIGGDGATPRRGGRFAIGAHQYCQRSRRGGRAEGINPAATPEGQDKCCRVSPDRHWLKFV